MIIETHVRGVPTPTLRWCRDGVELDVENSDKFLVMREPDGLYKLCIHDPQKIDGGRFLVEASNRAGKEEIRLQIRFLGQEHYKYTAGIYHADKKPEEEGAVREEPYVEPPPPEPEQEEDLMDKWGNMKPKKVKKERLREKVLKPYVEDLTESAMLKEVRNRLVFESELKNTVGSVGHKVKLLCVVVGPNAKLEWFKDDEPMEFNPPKVKNTTSGNFGSITFLAVSEADAGVYKCVATNPSSTCESTCNLTVLMAQDPNWIKPTFTRNLREAYNQQCNDLILEVHVRGYPRPKVYWSKDGLEIEDGNDKFFTTRHPDGIYRLNIHDPLIKDSGRYSCTAFNEAGNEEMKYYLKIKARAEYIHTALLYHADKTQFAKYKEEEERKRLERLAFRPPPRPKPVEEVVVVPEPEPEESESEYETDISEYDEEGERIEHEPVKKIKKAKTPPPKEVTPPPKEPTPEPEVVQVVEKKERRERNWMEGAKEGVEPDEPAVVTPPKTRFHLEFLTKLENRSAVDGSVTKLYCQVSGVQFNVTWLFNGEPVEYDSIVQNKSTDTSAALLFSKVSAAHAGEYTCICKNRECAIEAKCKLSVIETVKPKEGGDPPTFPFGIKRKLYFKIHINCI